MRHICVFLMYTNQSEFSECFVTLCNNLEILLLMFVSVLCFIVGSGWDSVDAKMTWVGGVILMDYG